MAIGPGQRIVLGFHHPEFHGEIIAELERLRASDTVRVIDSLAVYRDPAGEVEVEHLSNLTGLGIEGAKRRRISSARWSSAWPATARRRELQRTTCTCRGRWFTPSG